MSLSRSRRRHIVTGIALALGLLVAAPTQADPAIDGVAEQLLDAARRSLVAGDRDKAATLAHQAFEVLATTDRNGHKKPLTSVERELSTRR